MNAWIIYSGSLDLKKIELIVKKLVEKASEKNINLEVIKNNEILPYYDELGNARLRTIKSLSIPEFIIFWDKDIILARHLETMGFNVYNSSKAIEMCDNKSLTHLSLANLGIRVPKTILSSYTFNKQNLSDEYINTVFEMLGERLIIKESYGSFGMQVNLVKSIEEFKEVVDRIEAKPFLMQEYIDTYYGIDLRVTVIGDEIIGAIKRINEDDFRASLSQGGTGEIYKLNEKQKEITLKAHKALGLDFCGLDLLFGKDDEPILCEVNSNLNFIGFENITGIDFAGKLIDYILGDIK